MTAIISSIPGESMSEKNMVKKEDHVTGRQPFKDWPNDAGFNVSTEQKEPVQLEVKGKFPASVAGTLYRTGPGHYKVEDTVKGTYKTSHWFDGFSQVHRFQLTATENDTCKVRYNSRRQTDPLLEEIRKTGKLSGMSFGQKRDPCDTFFNKLKTVFHSAPNENVGVTIFPNPSGLQSLRDPQLEGQRRKTVVLKTDSDQYSEIDAETLEPMGITRQHKIHPELKGALSCAHPQYDPETGDLFNYNLDFGAVPTYRVFRTSFTTGKTEIIATIAEASVPAAYLHSFFLTRDFVVLAVWGSHFAGMGAKILWEKNLLDAISPLDPRKPTKWIVIDRRHGRGVVATYESPAMFSFHTVNAWQEETAPAGDGNANVNIVCDIVQYENIDILHKFYYENLVATGPGVERYSGERTSMKTKAGFVRYRLADIPIGGPPRPQLFKRMPTAEVLAKFDSPLVGDLPTINPRHSTKKSRFIYSVVDGGYSSFMDGLSKLDAETGKAVIWRRSKHTPGEPIFVADPQREGEDEGFLLSVLLDGEKGTSYLLCLDARTMEEVGRAECEVPVGFGFHGTHML